MDKMDRDKIMKIIPHRDPMLLVDEVLKIIPGESIEAKFFVDPDREIFKGHFPGNPVLPGVYTVEIMAQVSDILLLSMERYAGKVPLFIGIDKVQFKSKIEPGANLLIRSTLVMEKKEKAVASCRGEVYNDGILACEGVVTLAMR